MSLYTTVHDNIPAGASVGVRTYRPTRDFVWAAECDRLSQRLSKDLRLESPPTGGEAAAALVRSLLAEFAPDMGATHVFEVAIGGSAFAGIAVRMGLLQDPEEAAIVICGFCSKQLSVLTPPTKLPANPESFRAFQSALFLAFLAGWANRREYSSKLRLAATILAKNNGMVTKGG